MGIVYLNKLFISFIRIYISIIIILKFLYYMHVVYMYIYIYILYKYIQLIECILLSNIF